MKIVFTVHTYYPNKDGVQYVTQYLAEGLAKLGHDITVITSWEKKEKECQVYNGVKIVRLYLKAKYSILVDGKREYCKTVYDYVEDCDCLINCCVQSPNNNVLLPLLKKIKAKKILYMHGMHRFEILPEERKDPKYYLWHVIMNKRWSLFYKYHKRDFRRYDAMIDIHEESEAFQFMKKLGFKNKMEIIHNAVEDFDSLNVLEEDIKNNPLLEEKYFLCVANYNERKNQKDLVEAFTQIKEKNGYKLVLIGRGKEYATMLRELVRQNDEMKNIFILEDVPRNITQKYIKKTECGILSSRYEVYPIFIAETIACRKPFISTDVGCVREIPGGIIVKSIDELRDAMKRVIQDKNFNRKLGTEGYNYAYENLMQTDKIKQFEKLIKDLCK